MNELDFLNVEPFDKDENRIDPFYMLINRDENYEERYEKPTIVEVEDFEECHDPNLAC